MTDLRKLPTYRFEFLLPITNQCFSVYTAMRRNGGSISATEAMLDLDITSATLARRICDLEEAGVIVQRDRRRNKITGKRYTRYILQGYDPMREEAQARV